MSVLEDFTAPNQPTTGSLSYVPLGGNGRTAPFAYYAIKNAQVTGDGTGGTATIRVRMDDRYAAFVAHAVASVQQGTPADAEFRWTLTSSPGPVAAYSGVKTSNGGSVSSTSIDVPWVPPPIVQGGGDTGAQLAVAFDNVDSDVYLLNALILLFDIRVRELTPLAAIFGSRGTFGGNTAL